MTSLNDRLDACAARVDALGSRFDRFAKRRADAMTDYPVYQAPADSRVEEHDQIGFAASVGQAKSMIESALEDRDEDLSRLRVKLENHPRLGKGYFADW